MADTVDADGSGSDYDTISDISSLGSYGDNYAAQIMEEAAAREAAKQRRKSTKRNSVLKLDGTRRKSTARRKSKMPEGQRLTEESLAAQTRQEARQTKRLMLKGLNERVLGLDEDIDGGDVKSADEAPSLVTPPSVINAALMSASAPDTPLRPRSGHATPHTSKPPSRAPSPKINLLGSSRVAPVPEGVIAQPDPAHSIAQSYEDQPTVLPAHSPTKATGEEGEISPPADGRSVVSSRPNSSGTATYTTTSPRGSFASSTGGGKGNVMPSAVSERRKAAAAARAAKLAGMSSKESPTIGTLVPSSSSAVAPAPDPAPGEETGSNASSAATVANSTDRESSTVQPFAEPAKVPAMAKAKSKRRVRGKESSGSSEASSESAEYTSSGDGSEEDDRSRRRQKEKQSKQKEREKEKEKERERRAKEKQKEEKERARREKEIEQEKEARRAEKERKKKEEQRAPDPTAVSSRSEPAKPAPMMTQQSGRSMSFGRRAKEPFCRVIKSTTYLNAIRITHGEVPKVLCASADSTVQIHSIIDGTQLSSLVGHTDRVISLAVSNPFMYADKASPGGSAKATLKTLVASGSRDEQLRIWDMDTGRCLHAIHAHKSPIWAVAIAVRPDGDVVVVTTSGDGGMRSWNGKTGKKINNFKGHTDKILSVFIMNPLGEVPLVLSAGSDKKIRVWELQTGAHIRMLEGHEDEINSVVAGSFSGISSLIPIRQAGENSRDHVLIPGLDPSKSTVIVSGSKDLTVRVWDFRSGHLLFELLGHTACVYEVALIKARDSPLANGAGIPAGTPIIVSCSEDATVKLWNLVTGKLIKSHKWHSVSVRGIDVAAVTLPGGDATAGIPLIASCGWDKTIQFHELGEALYAKKASMCSIM